MTPAALRSYRILRNLGLPAGVLRKVAIGMDGRPNFSRLSDAEFDRLMRAVRRVYPMARHHKEEGGSVEGVG